MARSSVMKRWRMGGMLQLFMRVGVSARSIFGWLPWVIMQATLCFPQELTVFAHPYLPSTLIKAMTIWNPYAAYLFLHIISGNGL